jgi:hypothetical protein
MRCKLCNKGFSGKHFSLIVQELGEYGYYVRLELTFHPKCWLKLFMIELTPLGFEGSEDPDFSVVVRKKERQRIPLTLSDT